VRPSSKKPIGVFDSGLGGLTVLSELTRLLPNEDTIYVGDTARVPYGTKSPEVIRRYAAEVALFLMRRRVKMLVAACNSVSSVALPGLKKLPVPVLGVIEPGARAAVRATRNHRIGVIGTPATIRSQSYKRESRDPLASVVSQACPLFVPVVEEGWVDRPAALSIAREYLKPLQSARIDTLVLGCTHYPLLKKVIRKVMGRGVMLIDSGRETAAAVKASLEEHGLLADGRRTGSRLFFSSDDEQRFKEMSRQFLGWKAMTVRRVRWG
jgi:glutamate racemase